MDCREAKLAPREPDLHTTQAIVAEIGKNSSQNAIQSCRKIAENSATLGLFTCMEGCSA